MKPKQVVIFVIAALLLIILLQNTQVINFHILFWKISMSQIILMLIIIILSFALGYFSHYLIGRRKTAQKKQSE
jgi:uncharacterized integral membrane protein